MKNIKHTKHEGFTLVELLIVIVVIGILSAMMMLSSTEAVTSAKASNIISNLRNLKTAALAYYVDNLDHLRDTDIEGNTLDMADNGTRKGIYRYLNEANGTALNNTFTADGYTYTITAIQRTNGGDKLADAKWYLSCVVTDIKVQQKLAGRAKSVSLLSDTEPDPNKEASEYKADSSGANSVYYLVR